LYQLLEIIRTAQAIGIESPNFLSAFMNFNDEAEKEGALTKKTKKLILIALAIATKCELCVSLHVKEVLYASATPDEIMKTSQVAALMGGAQGLMFA
jgi:AhpD family alkylhydroperoxidase